MIYTSNSEDLERFDPIVKYGHFILTTGRHSDAYINKDAIALFPELFNLIMERFSDTLQHIDNQYDTIVSPAVAGIPFGSPLAYRKKKLFIYPEKKDSQMVFRKVLKEGLRGKKVVIVEDIVTTGSSILKTIEAVESAGAEVIGSIAVWLRATEPPADTKLLYAIIHKAVESYPADSCPLCYLNEIPLTHPKTGEVLAKMRGER